MTPESSAPPAVRAGRSAPFWPWIAAAAAVALAARLAFGFLYWTDKPLTQDEREYLQLGWNLAAGRGFVYDRAPETNDTPARRSFSRAPGYPFFLAAVFRVADAVGMPAAGAGDRRRADAGRPGETGAPGGTADERPGGPAGPAGGLGPGPAEPDAGRDRPDPRSIRTDGAFEAVPGAVKAAQALVGTIGVVLLGLAARRTAGPTAGCVAALAAALYPPLMWTTAYAFSETLFVTLALCSLLAIWRALDEGRDRPRWPVFVAGVLAGAATLTRPATLVFLGLAGLWLIGRRRPAALLALAAGALLVVAPWTARNYAAHSRFVLVAAEGGVTFWTGNHPLAIGEGDMAANPAIKRAFLEFEARHPGQTNEEIERLYYQEAFRFIRESPGNWIWLVARKAFYTVVPVGPSYRLHSMRYLVLSVASYLVILPFGIAGFVRLRRAGSPPVTLTVFLASAVVVSLAFFPQERFRLSIVDPVLLVWASAWVAMKVRGSSATAASVEEAAC